MELSDDLFEDIRKTLGLRDGDGDGGAKRRASRTDASRARAELELPGSLNPRRRVTLIDLGRGGVSFFDNQPC